MRIKKIEKLKKFINTMLYVWNKKIRKIKKWIIYNVMEKNKNMKNKNKFENTLLWNVDVKKIKKIEKLKN